MKFNKQIFWIFVIFLFLRVILIFNFPPFIDESLYTWWGKQSLIDQEKRFVAIYFWGKQPLPFWIFGWGSFFFENPITGARLLNLILTIPSFFFLYHLVKNLKSRSTAIFALILFTFSPAFILFQSLALMDGMLLTLNIIALWVLFKLWKRFTIKNLIFLGIILGVTFWIKSIGLILILLSAGSLIYFLLDKKEFSLSNTAKLGWVLLTYLITSFPLFSRNDFQQILLNNQPFSLSQSELVHFPLSIWSSNLIHFLFTMIIYLSPTLILALFFLKKEFKKKPFKFLVIWFLLSSIPLILIARNISFRYFLFSLASLLPLLAIGMENFLKHFQKKVLFKLIFFGPLFVSSFLIIFTPSLFFLLLPEVPFLHTERDYAYSWPSGYGVIEAWRYFKSLRKSDQSQAILALPMFAGSVPTSFILASLKEEPNLKVTLIIADSEKQFKEIVPLANSQTVYLYQIEPNSQERFFSI